MDRGATKTVLGIESLQGVQTKEGPATGRCSEYEVANGERVPNHGEQQFLGVNTEGVSRQIVGQVCDVSKPLLSVKKIMSAGNKVVFDPDGS